MNRWAVYEWLKQTYMFSGRVPTLDQVKRHFGAKIDKEELREGIIEFVLVVKKAIRPYKGKGYRKDRRKIIS